MSDMNYPEQSKLVVSIFGLSCSFDGRRWVTPVTRLTDRLNDITARIPAGGNSYDLALRVFRKSGLTSNPDARPHVVDWSHDGASEECTYCSSV